MAGSPGLDSWRGPPVRPALHVALRHEGQAVEGRLELLLGADLPGVHARDGDRLELVDVPDHAQVELAQPRELALRAAAYPALVEAQRDRLAPASYEPLLGEHALDHPLVVLAVEAVGLEPFVEGPQHHRRGGVDARVAAHVDVAQALGDAGDGGEPVPEQRRRRTLRRHRHQREVVAADRLGPAFGDRGDVLVAPEPVPDLLALLGVVDRLEELLPRLHAAVLHRLGPHRRQRAREVTCGEDDLDVGVREGFLDEVDLGPLPGGEELHRDDRGARPPLDVVDQPQPEAVRLEGWLLGTAVVHQVVDRHHLLAPAIAREPDVVLLEPLTVPVAGRSG